KCLAKQSRSRLPAQTDSDQPRHRLHLHHRGRATTSIKRPRRGASAINRQPTERKCTSGLKTALKTKRNIRSLHYATPDFLLILVALVHFMRLFLTESAHAAMPSA